MSTTGILVGALVAGAVLAGRPADAALSDVHLGNFYYEDATVGDGKIEVSQGDQIRFIADDGGPGTPHTVEVDELGIHSGGLATGQTYTTPPIQQAGTFTLYCKFHENKGHVTTLVVRGSPTATTTTARSAATTTAAPPATAPGGPGTLDGATGASDAAFDTTTSISPDGSPSTTATDPATDTTLAPRGLGEATADELSEAPVDPRSLEALLGRPPAARGPWTRSVWMALVGLIPFAGAAALALARFTRGLSTAEAEGQEQPSTSPSAAGSTTSSHARRSHPLRADETAVDPT